MPLGLVREASALGQSDKPKPPEGPPALPLMDAPEKPPVQVALDDLEGFDAPMPPPVIPPPVPATGNAAPSLPATDDALEPPPPLSRQESLDFILDAPAVVPPPVNFPPMPNGEESTTVNPPPTLPADVTPKPKKPQLRKVTGSWGDPLLPAKAEITAVGATLGADVAASRRSSASSSPGSSATSSRRTSRSPSRRNSCSLRDMLEPKAPAWERRQKLQRKGSRSSTPNRMWSSEAPGPTNMFAAAELKAEAEAMEATLTGMGMVDEQENQPQEVKQTERGSNRSAKVAPAELTLGRCTSEVPIVDLEPEAAPQTVPRHTLDALGAHSSSKHPAITALLGNVSGCGPGAEDLRVWQRIESTRENDPDTLERLRTECTNYAVVTALLAGSATEAFMNPPEFDEDWQKNAFGVTCGMSVMLLLMNVILSTIIIIHTNLCCKRTQTDFYLAIVDDLTYPNTICFYVAIWMTPVWMCLAAIPNYGYGVALPVCGAGLLLFIFLFYVFMKHATKINAMTISPGIVTPRLSAVAKWESISPVVTPRLSAAGKYQS